MNYKDAVCQSMRMLAADPMRVFVGYNVAVGEAGGTLAGIPPDQLIETPVAENLIIGLAMGLALQGFKPVVWIERCDFVMNALDAIVNHLDKLPEISRGHYAPSIIIRTQVGMRHRPLFNGPTHNQDHTDAISLMVNFPVLSVKTPEQVVAAYERAKDSTTPTMVVEHRDSY